MMPAIGTDEKVSEILSALLSFREPDSDDVRCAIDSIMRLIEEERTAIMQIVANERALLNRITFEQRGVIMVGAESIPDWKAGEVLARILMAIQERARSTDTRKNTD